MTQSQDEAVGQADEAPSGETVEELAKRVADLEKNLGEMDPRLTGRINTLNTTVASTKADLGKKIGGVETDLATLKSSVDNNAASIGSFQGQLDTLTHKVSDAETATTLQKKRLDNTEAWQSAFNTAFVNGIQSAKDFALEQGQGAKVHADGLATQLHNQAAQDKAELGARIKTVENAPVKPHKHAVNVHVDAVTRDPVTGEGNE